jgi:hypothetical protein
MDIVAVTSSQKQPTPSPQLHYLGTRLVSESRGYGVVTFEEVGFTKPHRMLRAVFEDGSVLEGCEFYLRALGTVFLEGRVLDLPHEQASLNGHHGAYGLGLDERRVRARMTELRAVAA